MERVAYCDPPPNWKEVVILWSDINVGPRYPIREILAWIDEASGGRYHLHRHNCTDGFAFRFENPHDAFYFKLKWL